MAMLAGPRRKQKVINLRAKNNAWSEDSSKFGQRMLERMGWAKGKGLGAREDGTVEHVIARYKNDEHGLGFTDKSDQWTQHEDQFNVLLANLSDRAGDVSLSPLHSGVSLEVKSKQSKARVHYHKFTRGKDLSRYSQKDLANIFGKKSLAPAQQSNAASSREPAPHSTRQVFKDSGTMDHYFKSKLISLGKKVEPVVRQEDVDYEFKGFSEVADSTEDAIKEDQQFDLCNNRDERGSTGEFNYDDKRENLIKKVKRKNKKIDPVDIVVTDNEGEEIIKKKKHKSINLSEVENQNSRNCIAATVNNEFMENVCVKKDKKKSKKQERGVLLDEKNERPDTVMQKDQECEHNDQGDIETLPKKKKCKRKENERVVSEPEELCPSERPIKKKKKKDKK